MNWILMAVLDVVRDAWRTHEGLERAKCAVLRVGGGYC